VFTEIETKLIIFNHGIDRSTIHVLFQTQYSRTRRHKILLPCSVVCL